LTSAPDLITVTIPNMYQSFVASVPAHCPQYGAVRSQSETFIAMYCDFSPKMKQKITKCNFSYFCAVAAPHADAARFRTMCDWGNWVFPFDDMFDNGHYATRAQEAQHIMDLLMAPMLGHTYDKVQRHAILRFHDRVVDALLESTPNVLPRFARAMEKYCLGAVKQVENTSTQSIPTLDEMVLIRRESAGVSPLYHLIEYAHDLKVPDEAFNSPIIQEMEVLGMDLVSISNDILSYRKEEREGVMHNMVAICRIDGSSAQEAFDQVGILLTARYRRWDEVEALFEASDLAKCDETRKYVAGIKSVVQANISWSFKSQRYLGTQAELVRQTRKIDVLARSPFE
jgi:hypothetical protein